MLNQFQLSSNVQKLATILKRMAIDHGSVMLIGHGIFNRFVAKELKSDGWRGPKNPGNNYWEYGVYEPIAI